MDPPTFLEIQNSLLLKIGKLIQVIFCHNPNSFLSSSGKAFQQQALMIFRVKNKVKKQRIIKENFVWHKFMNMIWSLSKIISLWII